MIAMYSFCMCLPAIVVLCKIFTWWHGLFWHEAVWKASSPQQKVNHGSFGSLRPRKESWLCWKNQLLDWIPRFDVSIYMIYIIYYRLLSIYYRNHIKSHQITWFDGAWSQGSLQVPSRFFSCKPCKLLHLHSDKIWDRDTISMKRQ